MENRCLFGKDVTNSVKAVLIFLMYILHFFCFPSWYVGGVSYPELQWMQAFQGHFQICPAGFTFLTGYFYYYSEGGTIRYIVKKWLDLYIPYWCVFITLVGIAVLTKTYKGSLASFFLELIGLKSYVIYFGWYVAYYLFMMPTLVILVKYIRNDVLLLGMGLFLPIMVYYVLAYFIPNSEAVSILSKFQVYFPITLIGFLSSKNKLFDKADKIIGCNRPLKYLVAIACIIIVFMEPSWLYGISANGIIFNMIRKIIRIISIAFFMYGLLSILRDIPEWMKFPLKIVGLNSAIMWFVHSIFFNCSKEIFQPILYCLHNPMLVLLWGIILNLCISIPINCVAKLFRHKVKI